MGFAKNGTGVVLLSFPEAVECTKLVCNISENRFAQSDFCISGEP